MENRFGVKDLFLFVLLVALIVAIFLAMKQYDRQWSELQTIGDTLTSQTREINQLRRMLQEGVTLNRSAQAATTQPTDGKDPFVYIKKAEANKDFALGDWLVSDFPVKVAVLTPLLPNTDAYSAVVQARVQESLAYRDPYTLEYLPLLATSWQKSADGRTITFQLRRGVAFSDGYPFTADDVVFTYNWIMNPAVAAPRDRAYVSKITAVEKKNDYEVVFKFNEPYFESFDLASGLQIMPKHFYEKYTPQQFNESTGLLMGTGPYMLKDPASWRPGDRIELVRNERYWGEPATFDRLVWHEVEQESASLTMFKNGETDAFAAQPEQYREMLKDAKLLERTQHFQYASPLAGYTYVAWNQQQNGKPTPFADKRVRQAMTLLTDRQRMVDEVMLGYGQVATGPFSPLTKQADPNVKPWPYDPQRAKALLKEAGYEDRNGDGVIEGPDGKPFRFKLTYGSNNRLGERIALFLKDDYAKAGIAMEPDPVDWPIMLRKLDGRDFDAITLAWTGSMEGDIYQMFHSSQIADKGDDFMSYANPELDKVIEQARATVDEDQRMPLWQKAHRIIHEDQPYTFLFDRLFLVFYDKRIRNIEPSRIGLNYYGRYVMPIPWYVPKGQQKWSR